MTHKQFAFCDNLLCPHSNARSTVAPDSAAPAPREYLLCKACGGASYCDVVCQKADWHLRHKNGCRYLQAFVAELYARAVPEPAVDGVSRRAVDALERRVYTRAASHDEGLLLLHLQFVDCAPLADAPELKRLRRELMALGRESLLRNTLSGRMRVCFADEAAVARVRAIGERLRAMAEEQADPALPGRAFCGTMPPFPVWAMMELAELWRPLRAFTLTPAEVDAFVQRLVRPGVQRRRRLVCAKGARAPGPAAQTVV